MKEIHVAFPLKFRHMEYIIINDVKYINSRYKPIDPQNRKERLTC